MLEVCRDGVRREIELFSDLFVRSTFGGEARPATIVGVIWGLWYAPLLIAGLNYPGVNPWIAIAMFVPTAVLMSLLFTRLYVAAGGAVLAAALLHGSVELVRRLGATKRFVTDHTLLTSPGGAIAIGIFALMRRPLMDCVHAIGQRARSDARPELRAEPAGTARGLERVTAMH